MHSLVYKHAFHFDSNLSRMLSFPRKSFSAELMLAFVGLGVFVGRFPTVAGLRSAFERAPQVLMD